MKTMFRLFLQVLALGGVLCTVLPVASLCAEETWYPGEAECLGVVEGRPRVILTTVDGKKLALELRGPAESLMSKVLPEGKVAKVRVKGELKNRTLIVTEYELTSEGEDEASR